MDNTKKYITPPLLLTLLLLGVVGILISTTSVVEGRLANPLGESINTVPLVIGKAIKGLLGLTGVAGLIMFIWGGIQLMLSEGASKKYQQGIQTLVWSSVGIATVFGSYAIVSFVLVSIIPGAPSRSSETATGPVGGNPPAPPANTPPSAPPTPSKAGPPAEPSSQISKQPGLKDFKVTRVGSSLKPTKPDAYNKNNGATMNDITTHLTYTEPDPQWLLIKDAGQRAAVVGHEYKHRLEKELSAYWSKEKGVQGNAFYDKNGEALFIASPTLAAIPTVTQLRGDVPQSIKEIDTKTYQMYYGEIAVDDTAMMETHNAKSKTEKVFLNTNPPLAILMELSGYTTGSIIEEEENAKPSSGTSFYLGNTENVPSFSVFSLALAVSIVDKDKTYLDREPQFKESLKFMLENGMTSYNNAEYVKGVREVIKSGNTEPFKKESPLKSPKVLNALKNNKDCEKLRQLARDWYNTTEDPDWTERVLGFK